MNPRAQARQIVDVRPQPPGATAPGQSPWPTKIDFYHKVLFLVIVFAISKLPGYFGFMRALRVTLLLVVICGVYAALNPKKLASGSLFRTWPVKVVTAIAVMACLSVPFGISMGHAGLFMLENFAKTYVLFALVVTAVRSPPDLRRITWAFAVGGGILAYMSIFVVGISKENSAATYDANDVGLVMNTTLPVALLCLQTSRNWKQRAVAILCVLLMVVTVSKTQSRGAFVGLVAVGAGLLVLLPGVSVVKRIAYMGIAVAAIVLFAPAGYWDSMKTLLEDPKADYNYDAVNGRRMIAKRGIGYMMQYPVFGVGIDNFRLAEGTLSDKAQNAAPNTGVRWAAAHNSFVQAGAEIGIPGLALWSGLLVGGIIWLIRLRRTIPTWKKGNPEQVFLFFSTGYIPIALIAFSVTGFFVSFAWMEPYYILAAILAGIYTSVEMEQRRVQGVAEPVVASGPPGPRRGMGLRNRAVANVPLAPLPPGLASLRDPSNSGTGRRR